MKTDIRILEHLLALHLDVNIWSARKKLSPQDFAGDAVLPPDDLASLGSKRICDPEELRVFGMLKSRAVNLLDRHGIRFLGGWALPEAKAEDIIAELELIEGDFQSAKETFLARYDQSIQEWIAKHEEWERIIAGSLVSADYVRSRMGFSWRMYRIAPPHENDPFMKSLTQEVETLGQTLFGEVAKAATEAWHGCYAGKTAVTRKALSPLKTIEEKLRGLSFVEPRVAPIADLLHTAFVSLPRKGKIEGQNLLMLQGLVSLLRDTEALLEHGEKILMDGDGDMLAGLLEQVEVASSCAVPLPPPPAAVPNYGLW